MIDERIDRSRIEVVTFAEADAADLAYWLARTPAERVEGIEYLRRWAYGDAAVDAGLQRVLVAVELGRD